MKKYEKSVLPNGLSIFSSHSRKAESFSLNVLFRAGSRHEDKNQGGYAHLLEHLIFSAGKKYRNDIELKTAVDTLGSYINAKTDSSIIRFSIEALTKDAEVVFELLSDVLVDPIFREKELVKEKRIVIREIQANRDNPAFTAGKLALTKTFNGHPLSNHPEGEEQTINSATTDNLNLYYKMLMGPNRMAIISAGGISHNKAEALSERYFSGLRNYTEPQSDNLSSDISKNKNSIYFREESTRSTHLVFNFITTGPSNYSDLMALELINTYLGRGAAPLLKQELRMKQGLIYTLSSYNTYYEDTGRFVIQTSTTSPNETIDATIKILSSLSKRLNEKMLEEIKTKTVNSLFLLNANPVYSSDLTHGFATQKRLVSTEEKIALLKKVSLDNLKGVLELYLTPDNLFIVALGPKKISSVFQRQT